MDVDGERPAQEPAAGGATFKQARVQSEESKKRAQKGRPFTAFAGRALLGGASLVPLRWLQALGRGAGRLGARLPLREVTATRRNLELCFPELTLGEREQGWTAGGAPGPVSIGGIAHFRTTDRSPRGRIAADSRCRES